MRKFLKIIAAMSLLVTAMCLASCQCEHEYTLWVTTKPATCVETGIQSRNCTKCDAVETQTLNALGHSIVVDKAKAPTCTAVGKTEGSHCSTCGLTMAEQKNIPAKGHTEVIDAAVEATCTKEGKTQGKHCSVCREVITAQKTVAKKAHTKVTDKAVAATCASTGKTEGSHCSVCDTVIVAQKTVAKKTTHSYTKGTCSVCGVKDPNYVKVYGLGETWVVDGQWEFTVNSVKNHYLCEDWLNESEGYTNEQVVIIEYTYKNIGYKNSYSDLVFQCSAHFYVYDEDGEAGDTYYSIGCDHTVYRKECIVGTKCTASGSFVFNNKSKTILLHVKHTTTNGLGSQEATFELPVK